MSTAQRVDDLVDAVIRRLMALIRQTDPHFCPPANMWVRVELIAERGFEAMVCNGDGVLQIMIRRPGEDWPAEFTGSPDPLMVETNSLVCEAERGPAVGHTAKLDPDDLERCLTCDDPVQSEFERETRKHIHRVRELLLETVAHLIDRAVAHDETKLQEPERSGFINVKAKLAGLTYGSPEYEASLKELQSGELGNTLQHHYSQCRHHAEHHARGINGMTLVDLLESILDWKAAGERHDDGSFARSMEINRTRFGLSDQLYEIIMNTGREMGWIPAPETEAEGDG